jgi:23S rRNA C2498 (ribose-2'-O)-methylase RlmM
MRNKKDTANADVTAKGLREQLKAIMARELEQLPELLEALPPQERIKAVLQLLPYITPKVETCAPDYGEPFSW